MTNYEIDARVPLIIAQPGLKLAGQQTDQLPELLDLFPTLCDLTGIEKPDFADGSSLVPVLQDVNATVHDQALSQYYRKLEGAEYMGYSMRTNEYRLVEWRDFSSGEVTTHELYDHRTDDLEHVNIIESAPQELVDRLTNQLIAKHPRRGLNMTPAVHSNPNPGRWQTEIAFKNESETELMVFPITPQGRRGRVKRVLPQKRATFNARIGGVYVVESADRTIYEIHSPSFPPKEVVIK